MTEERLCHLRAQGFVAAVDQVDGTAEKSFPRDGAADHGARGAGAVARAAVEDAPVLHDEEPTLLHVHGGLVRLGVGCGARRSGEGRVPCVSIR